MESIATAVVKENWNEDLPGHVKVEYALGEEGECVTGWIPVMVPYGGAGYGDYRLPEVGSKVVVGFNYGSEDRPIVLGCLRSGADAMPEGAAAEENTKKLFRARNGYQILIDEEKKKLTIGTAAGENEISIQEESGVIRICGKEKIEFTIDGTVRLSIEKDRITIADAAVITEDIELKSKSVIVNPENDITLKGKSISMSPQNSVTLEGNTVEVKPSQKASVSSMQVGIEGTKLEVKGKGNAKVEAQGILEVKGALLKLN